MNHRCVFLLFCFLVHRVLGALFAKLIELNALFDDLFILARVVVNHFAVGALKLDHGFLGHI